MDVTLMNFSGLYINEEKHFACPCRMLDFSDIEGTNCYCDDEAEKAIKKRMADVATKSIHFIDTGNFHYVTKFFIERSAEPFTLVVFDNHTDMGEPAFGGMLSCGSWIRSSMDEMENLKKVVLLGVRGDLAEAIDKRLKQRTIYIDSQSLRVGQVGTVIESLETKNVYVSIDKDVLDEESSFCNWDQGRMDLETLKQILSIIRRHCSILGVDICGGPEMKDIKAETTKKNNATDEAIVMLLHDINIERVV